MAELPFVLAKRHKSRTKSNWKKYGIKFRDDGHFEFVYYEYIRATNCELCNKLFTKSNDRQLDHDHITCQPRHIVCNKCNHRKKDNKKIPTNTGYDYIHKRKDKNYKTGYSFQIRIVRDEQNIINTQRKSLEEAIIVRDEFLAKHPEIYT
jgi:hypothetical protein